MSEEILKALTQLFAIITKQDGGVTEKERAFVIGFFKQELDQDSIKEYLQLYDEFSGYGKEEEEEEEEKDTTTEQGGEPRKRRKKKKLTSVRDSVKTLGLCRKINKTLTQKQKVVVLIKILELVSSDKNFTSQRMQIIDTISTVFNIVKDEYRLVESFVMKEHIGALQYEDILIVNNEIRESQEKTHVTNDGLTDGKGKEEALSEDAEYLKELKDTGTQKHFHAELQGNLIFLRLQSVDMYFVKYVGEAEIVLNGFIMQTNRVYLFSHGSTIKTPAGDALYYSDLVSHFLTDQKIDRISFNATKLQFKFPNGGIGLRNINISEGAGRLIGIMGASGAGKTTLMNVLAGIETPSEGSVKINGHDIHKEKEKIHGVIGYVSQDDLLIEELTVYQNLYYNAKLCFANYSEEELDKRVMEVLTSLGLDQRKDLKVGNPLEKTISGGQRKRLNIALELIREPAVMFVDEPTSGLSSRDSENVIDLLKELSLKGKLIFVVIHQPSSDIYKMFDKMYIMDTGGYPIFYGNPIEAVVHFKEATNQVDSYRGQCETCGNVNPEQIFNIIEAKVVDEYGQFTNKRKINPLQWNELYVEKFTHEKIEDVHEDPPGSLNIPNKIKQSTIFTIRDLLSKISNKQYLLINLLEAPLLALILAFIIKYRSSPDGESYIFRFNENIPAFMLMSIIVALFMGLTVSAEEIIRDRKILKRESFLNLSWNSYLASKIAILFMLSAIQTLSFVLIGNLILEIKGMTFSYWLVLFTVSCMSNVLGLNISASFKSAVTVYIIIPLILIPQMILSGLLFSFDRLNNLLSTKGKVPIVADFMASRWAYEAIAVHQFTENDFEAPYFSTEKKEMRSDFKAAYVVKELRKQLSFVNNHYTEKVDSVQEKVDEALHLLKFEINKEPYKNGLKGFDPEKELSLKGYSKQTYATINTYLDSMRSHYLDEYNAAVNRKEKMMATFEKKFEGYNTNEYKNKYFNESLSDLVRNISTKDRLIEYKGKLVQQIDPIYHEPEAPKHLFDYRTHFFAPKKHFLNSYYNTYYFNIVVIWLMTILLYFTLYFEILRKLLDFFSNITLSFNK